MGKTTITKIPFLSQFLTNTLIEGFWWSKSLGVCSSLVVTYILHSPTCNQWIFSRTGGDDERGHTYTTQPLPHWSEKLPRWSKRAKGFDVGVARGLDVKDILTITSKPCNSRSLIFLITSAQRVTLRLGNEIVGLKDPTPTRLLYV